MKVETEILLKEYKEEFKNYKNYLDANNWFDDIQEDKNGNLYSNKLNTELSIVSTILKSMKKFKEDVGEDAHLKPIKKFIDDDIFRLSVIRAISKNDVKLISGFLELFSRSIDKTWERAEPKGAFYAYNENLKLNSYFGAKISSYGYF